MLNLGEPNSLKTAASRGYYDMSAEGVAQGLPLLWKNAYFILFSSFLVTPDLSEVSFSLLLARLPRSTSLTLNSRELIP